MALAATVTLVAPLGCLGTPLPGRAPPRGSYTEWLTHSPGSRPLVVHVPEGLGDATPRPLVVVLHGAGGSARQMEADTGFSRLADREGFVALYPLGVSVPGLELHGFSGGPFRHWNAGFCCGRAKDQGVDDEGFVLRSIERVREKLAIDGRRIFLVGYSNGAMLAHKLAARAPELFAAVAPYAGATPATGSVHEPVVLLDARGAVSTLVMHGVSDTRTPHGSALWGSGMTAGADPSARFWAAEARCRARAQRASSHGGAVRTVTWGDCAGGKQVRLMSLEGWDHEWPSAEATTRRSRVPGLRGFDAAEAMWAFFREVSTPRGAGGGAPVEVGAPGAAAREVR